MEIVNQPKAFYRDHEVQTGRTTEGKVVIEWDTVLAAHSTRVPIEEITIMSNAVLQ